MSGYVITVLGFTALGIAVHVCLQLGLADDFLDYWGWRTYTRTGEVDRLSPNQRRIILDLEHQVRTNKNHSDEWCELADKRLEETLWLRKIISKTQLQMVKLDQSIEEQLNDNGN